mmetsp:Transcript_30893/g.100701  ORF Transcript_30893/g.100701 Transcript_30893/m.100701 type:complete len:226 (-) Transcript_30893:75-752(-)
MLQAPAATGARGVTHRLHECLRQLRLPRLRCRFHHRRQQRRPWRTAHSRRALQHRHRVPHLPPSRVHTRQRRERDLVWLHARHAHVFQHAPRAHVIVLLHVRRQQRVEMHRAQRNAVLPHVLDDAQRARRARFDPRAVHQPGQTVGSLPRDGPLRGPRQTTSLLAGPVFDRRCCHYRHRPRVWSTLLGRWRRPRPPQLRLELVLFITRAHQLWCQRIDTRARPPD